MSLVDEVTSDVAAIGALNTVLISDGATVGHNTDVSGFGRAFTEGLPGAALDELVLLGAGGAGTAVAHALVRLGARRVQVFDPDAARADALVRSVEASGPDADVRRVLGNHLPACSHPRRGWSTPPRSAWPPTPAPAVAGVCCAPTSGSPTSSTARS